MKRTIGRVPGWAALLTALLLAACGEPAAPVFREVEMPGDTRDPVGPYLVTAVIEGADSAAVFWRVASGGADAAPESGRMADLGAGWQGQVPGRPAASGTAYEVWIEARNGGGVSRSGTATFRVLDPDGACLVDGQCLPGEICSGGRCGAPPPVCRTDADCGQDLYCPAPGEVCRFRPTACEGDGDCAPGDRCVDGSCSRPRCLADRDCPGGRCVDGRCAPPAPCEGDAECGDDEVCEGGVCVPGPAVPCPGGCPAGLRCLAPEARCVPCTADGHCGGGHCDTETFTCAVGLRGRPCVPCGPQTPCGGGYRCPADIGGACVPTCSAACEDATGCAGAICAVPEDRFCGGPICDVDGDCDSGVCLSGWCEPRQYCVRDDDCGDGRVCADGRCVFEADPCRRPGDCRDGELCLGGRCAPGRPIDACTPCDFDHDCPSPALCVPFEGGARRCAALCGSSCPGESLECLVVDAGLLVCLAPDASCPEDRCGVDRLEPDDEPRSSTRLPLGAVVEGRLCARDTDWLRVDLVPRGRFSVQTAGNLTATIFDSERTVLRAIDVPAGGDARVDLPDGAYFVRLATEVSAEFAWVVLLDGPAPPECDDDIFEPNGDGGRATLLGAGADLRAVACPGDVDWFSVRTRGRGGSVRIDAGESELDVRLLDEAEAPLVITRSSGQFDLPVPAGHDVVFAVVRCPGCADGAGYRLRTFLQ